MAAIASVWVAHKNGQCGLTTLNKPKSGQVSTNNGIMTQTIGNVSVLSSVELKKLETVLYFFEYSIGRSTHCFRHAGYQI